MLLEKLDIFPEEIEKRNYAADHYSKNLAGSVVTPFIPDGFKSVWAQYSVLAKNSDDRDAFQESLKKGGIPSVVYYPKPLHLQTAYRHFNYKVGDFPVSEEMSSRIFSLPMHPYLESTEIDKVVNVIRGV